MSGTGGPGAAPPPAGPGLERISLDGELGPVPALVAAPPVRSAAGVVLLHGAAGIDAGLAAVASRLAGLGYRCAVPDLLHRRLAPPPPAATPAAALPGVSDLETMVDVHAAVGWLRSAPGASGRVGVVGMGAGGRWALLLATGPIAPDRVVACAPGGLTRPRALVDELHPQVPIDRVPYLAAPLLVIAAAADADPSPGDIDALEAALDATTVEHRVVRLPGAGSGLLGCGDAGAVAGAWPELAAWLAPIAGG